MIEITSPSNPQNDYGIKLFKYRTAGVREYWIVNPQVKSVMVYDLENEKKSNQYTFDANVPVCIYEILKEKSGGKFRSLFYSSSLSFSTVKSISLSECFLIS